MIVTITPTGAPALTVINANIDTGYRLLPETDWGNAVWDTVYSGQRGTQGARAAGSTPQNRPLLLALRVDGSSKDALNDRVSALMAAGDDLRRFGGRVTTQLLQP